MPQTVERRVSFSNRIDYSDEVSTSSVSTDDDLSGAFVSDNESLGDDNNEQTLSNEPGDDDFVKESVDVERQKVAKLEEGKPDENKESAAEIATESWCPLDDEPPLVFRDAGVLERPSEYLGGYGPEACGAVPHRVKLRKSWLQSDDAQANEYNEFEEWVKSHKSIKDVLTEPDETNLESKEIVNEKEWNMEIEKVQPKKDQEPKLPGKDGQDTAPPEADTLRKPAIKEKNETASSVKVKKSVQTTNVKKLPASSKHSKTKIPSKMFTKRDEETKAHVEMKERIAKLQRKWETVEVRTISQLADIEEETTKRMREFRERASEIARKQKAKTEKLALKEQAMNSKDLIEQLRRSNQRLRSEGIKLRSAVAKLNEGNRLLEEKSTFHHGYALEFQKLQKTEIRLTEDMNRALEKDLPKYVALVRGMKESVEDRESSGHAERRAKEHYEDCMQSMVAMLEEYCSDSGLVEKVVTMVIESEQEPEVGFDLMEYAKNDLPRRSSVSGSSKNTLSPDSSNRRPSVSKSIRRCRSDGGGRNSLGVGGSRGGAWLVGDEKTSTKSSRSSMSGIRKVSQDEDSSTCSITSITSDNLSMAGEYLVGN